jgi:hypothetical protein
MLKKVLPLLLVVFLVASCSKDKFKAQTPSYLHIESIDLVTESFEGSSSHKITDAWITMDGNFLGAFEVPCIVPILAEGEHEFRISSGIKANGISATRITYPFYDVCDLFLKSNNTYQLSDANYITLIKDSSVVVNATTKYTENTKFLFIEDFEDAGAVLEMSEQSDTILTSTNIDSLVFEGYGSGEVHLDSVNDFFELISSEFMPMSSIYNATMLELNYRCDHSFKLGVAVKSADTGVIDRFESIQISPSSDWNKIYVHMTNQVNLGNSDDEFGVFIGSVKSSSVETASFYFDNIKWVHEQ